MNPITSDEARAYQVRSGHRSEMPEFRGDDGYEVIDTARDESWKPRAAWGLNGWDLGSWPLVVYLFRTVSDDAYELAEHIEGDIKVWRFPTDEMRSAWVDTLAFWWWKHEEQDWTDGYTTDAIPDHLRGAFSWSRLDAEKVAS